MWYKSLLIIHVLGACVWTGGHLILAVRYLPRSLRTRDPEIIRSFEGMFEPVGLPALALQVITGILIGMHYDIVWFSFSDHASMIVNLKLILLATIVGLAIHARLFLIPKLEAKTLMQLGWHIILVTLISCVLLYLGLSFRTGLP